MKAKVHSLISFVKDFLDDSFRVVAVDINYIIVDCYDYPTSYMVQCLNYYLKEIVHSTSVAKATVIGQFRVKLMLEHR